MSAVTDTWNKNEERAMERALHCRDCDRLIRATWTCKECGCFMKVKTRVPSAECPLGKW